MEHINHEFDADEGDVAEVIIDRAANVLLLDEPNYELYKQGGEFHHLGGYATKSPIRWKVPKSGRWHAVVDLGGGPGQVRSFFQLIARVPA